MTAVVMGLALWGALIVGFLAGCVWAGRARGCPEDCEGNVNREGTL